MFLCKSLNVIVGNSPRLFYPLFPLLQKRCLLRFGYGVWVLELSWTLFWISCKDSHVNKINFSRLVFVKKVINGNIAVVNDPVLHTLCLDTTDSCRHHKIRLRRQRIPGRPTGSPSSRCVRRRTTLTFRVPAISRPGSTGYRPSIFS